MTLLDEARSDCAFVAAHARHVSVDEEALERLAGNLATQLPIEMRHSPQHLIGDRETNCAYFLILDSLNFGSGLFEHIAPYRAEPGYFGLAVAIRDWIERDGPPSPDVLKSIDRGDVAQILGQDPANTALHEYFGWDAAALAELGAFVEKQLRGRYSGFLTRTGGDAAEMVLLLTSMPMFRDISSYNGRSIALLKRAQIAVHDLAIAEAQCGRPDIGGLDELTVFADNMLPYILRHHGVLHYSDDLSGAIAKGAFLEQGSEPEVELRAVSIDVCERIRAAIVAGGQQVSAREVDYLLWNEGDGLERSGVGRPHLCRTYFY